MPWSRCKFAIGALGMNRGVGLSSRQRLCHRAEGEGGRQHGRLHAANTMHSHCCWSAALLTSRPNLAPNLTGAHSCMPAPGPPSPRSLRMYNRLVERCFTDCVESFRRKDLDSAEEKVSAGTAGVGVGSCCGAGACWGGGMRGGGPWGGGWGGGGLVRGIPEEGPRLCRGNQGGGGLIAAAMVLGQAEGHTLHSSSARGGGRVGLCHRASTNTEPSSGQLLSAGMACERARTTQHHRCLLSSPGCWSGAGARGPGCAASSLRPHAPALSTPALFSFSSCLPCVVLAH